MKKLTSLFRIVAFLSLAAMSGCEPFKATTPSVTISSSAPTPGRTPTPVPHIIVWDASDSGEGTLRQALDTANAIFDDTNPIVMIKFETDVFSPDDPASIVVESELPHIHKSNLILDASNAGVILDGRVLDRDSRTAGLQIVGAHGVMIQGLQISNFPGPAIAISGTSTNNVIGGDRGLGAGPYGQGNMLTENEEGIDLAKTWLNTITGNLIGTNITGTQDLGNLHSGIKIWEGAHGNTIGPYNLIAYDGECGVYIEGTNSSGNTLTQNSIHENTRAGICLRDGANANIGAPYIFSIDWALGLVRGISCANCTIEIFSTQDQEEGRFYEGQVVANSNGAFTFRKNAAFRFDNITSTATDADGNTSGFSRPAGLFEISDLTMLQENNLSPGFLLLPKPSQFLPDNHIGIFVEGYDRYSEAMEQAHRNGFKWIRIQSLTEFWGDRYEYLNFSLESIPTEVDTAISEYTANGVNIVLDLWMGAGLEPYGATFQSQEEIDRYLEYARFIVSHFKGRIRYYQIWNEPGDVAVKDYANLVSQVVPVIREEDPGSKIIIGSIHGHWENRYPGYGEYQRFYPAFDYLNELLRSGVVDMVDGISWNPFFDNIPSDPYYQEYPQIVQGIKDLAASQGFKGEYFADAILWTTRDAPGWDNGPPVSQFIAAKYYTRAITEHRGLGLNVKINTFFQAPFLAPIHNLNDLLAGAEPSDIKLSLDKNVRYYAFALPNGDRLVALWTNDEAVEEDHGVSATLAMSSSEIEDYIGFSPQRVIGIDVLNGFEQELITETGYGDLAIRDLLIKDYPIILRFVK